MRILQLGKYYSPVVGGMETALVQLAEGLTQRGHEVTVLVASRDRRATEEMLNGVRVIRRPSYGLVASTPIAPTYANPVTHLDFDLVHLHLPNPLVHLAAHRLSAQIPRVVTYHCEVLSYPLLRNMYRRWMKSEIQRANKVIVSSPMLKAQLQWANEKVHCIPFATPAPGSIGPEAARLQQELLDRFPNGYVLFAGRLVKYKGVDVLLRALAESKFDLVLVGDGPERKRLEALASAQNVRAHFYGEFPLPTLSAFYSTARCLVLPSIDAREAFGLVMIEALAHGLPLISTRLGTGVDFVNAHGQTGWQVAAHDAKQLKEAIEQMFTDDATYTRMQGLAFERFQQEFQFAKMIDAHQELYASL